jgi:nucleoside-diphosphate-sugar epimerase
MELPCQFTGQKVLVTGASGFIGSRLSLCLYNSGYEVHAISRIQRANDTSHLRWWQGNLEDLATVRYLLVTIKPEVIFHLSGQVTAAPNLELVLPTFHSLLVSTINLLTAATEIGCHRIVLLDSLMEPGSSHANAASGSPYAAAKWASSVYGRMFHTLYRTPVVITRPFMTYGPGQDMRKLIPYVTLSLLRGEVPKLSSGRWQVDWIYVDDVVDGLLRAAQASNVEGCTIDLGSGMLVPIQTIVQQLIMLAGARVEPLFGALPDRPLEQVRVADTVYAWAKLGWRAVTSLEKGLEHTVEWYRKQLKVSS